MPLKGEDKVKRQRDRRREHRSEAPIPKVKPLSEAPIPKVKPLK